MSSRPWTIARSRGVPVAVSALLLAALVGPATAGGQTDALGELTQTLPKLTEPDTGSTLPDSGSLDPATDLLNQVSEPVENLLQSPSLPTDSEPAPSDGGGSESTPSGGDVSPSSTTGGARQAGTRQSAPTGSSLGSGGGSAPATEGGGGAGGARSDGRDGSGGGSAERRRGDEDDTAAATLRRVADRADEPGGIAGAIRQVVEVVPGPLKVLLGVLAGLVLILGGGYLIVTRRARRLARQRSELLEEVGLLQQALLPDVSETLGPVAASVAYRPAEGPGAGGDFYDAFELASGRVAVVVGDVSGHGRGALASTTLLRYTLRAYLDAGLEPRSALQVAGRTLDSNLEDEFATVVLAVYDAGAGTLTYASAGHPAPIVLGPGDHDPVTACSALPIGVSSTTGMRQTIVPLPEGALACFFTDGLIEARNGEQLLGRKRLRRIVESLSPGDGADALLAKVREASDRTPDDMAACLLRPTTAAVPDEERIEELEAEPADLPEAGRDFLIACGVDEGAADAALASARRSAAEHGRALLRVTIAGGRTTAEVRTVAAETLEQLATAPPAVQSA